MKEYRVISLENDGFPVSGDMAEAVIRDRVAEGWSFVQLAPLADSADHFFLYLTFERDVPDGLKTP